jgi:hypothetical protein
MDRLEDTSTPTVVRGVSEYDHPTLAVPRVLAGIREAGPTVLPLLPVLKYCVRIACIEKRNEDRVERA